MEKMGCRMVAVALLAVAGCADNGDSGGAQGDVCMNASWRCDTPACSQYPATPGCHSVAPTQQHCPLDHPHCFDPTTLMAYCAPSVGVCAMFGPAGMNCPPKNCSAADVAVCGTLDNDVFCRSPFTCVKFDPSCAAGDGGAPDGGAHD
jgi:hypothetical protein